MSVPESEGPGQNPGLFSSLRSFWSVLLAILYTRLDLATVELEEVGTHIVQVLLVSLAALLCIAMTIFFILFFLVVLSGSHLPLVLLIVCVLGILASIILVLAARHLIVNRPKFLSQTLAELRRDVEGLRHDIKNAGDQAMSTPGNVFAERREELSAQIAQQRGDLVAAYLRLEKPIHYAEYGLRGFGFLRKNPWVFAAIPAAFSIVSTLLSLRKKKIPEPEPVRAPFVQKVAETQKPLKIWIGRAVQLYKLYRRVRPYFP